MATLPIINPFLTPYEQWSTRTPSLEEMTQIYNQTGSRVLHVKDKMLARISNAFEAAMHMANVGVDNGLESHIDNELKNGTHFKVWRSHMPSQTPKELSRYQKEYPYCDFQTVTAEINSIGAKLSSGQILFHGGVWPGGDHFVAERPLSTSFCPQIALREAEHRGKSYDAGRIDLFVLRIAESVSNVFVYRQNGTNFGHEKEVLFAAGANLRLRNQTLVRTDYNVYKAEGSGTVSRKIPFYILEVDIS